MGSSHRFRGIPVTAIGAGGQEDPGRIHLFEYRSNGFQCSRSAPVFGHLFIAAHRIFVITAPPYQTGVIPQSKRRKFRFFPERLPEPFLFLRIIAAGHQKVLTDQNTQPVTLGIKMLRFKHTAAPNTDHIQTHLDRQLQNLCDFLIFHFGNKRLTRRPIRALAEDPLAVDHRRKTGIVFVKIPLLAGIRSLQLTAQLIAFRAGLVSNLQNLCGTDTDGML